ncbi:hypothetical protein QN277_018445 [Acacia crassicarpa]|uniref:Uncharacterized protein n=1 Tax=Acacia crassicarpa TaxID=499986 RepID=A0AAE1JRK5_9FABA|nr:hypothetical protein QN277_018445 [Acacia crassicarpa]
MNSEQKVGFRDSSELGTDKKLLNMSVLELVDELRVTNRAKIYDQVEEILVARETQLKDEVDKTRHIIELERLERMKIEAKLEECQKQCEKMKKVADLYEKLLANVKKDGLEDATVEELRAKKFKLEGKLKKCMGKFPELNDRVSKLESELKKLKKEGGGGADLGVTLLEVKKEVESDEIHDHGGDSGNNYADSNFSQRQGYPCAGIGQSSSNPNKDVLAHGRLGKRTYIDIPDIIEIEDSADDDDDDHGKKEGTSQDNRHPNSSAVTAQQNSNTREEDVLVMLKRKYGFNQILQRCPAHNTADKRSKA